MRDPPPAAHGVGRRGPSGVGSRESGVGSRESGVGSRESRVGAARGRRSPPVARAR
ncbi:hypothetical protein BURPS1106B_0503 [Burkholderia pseudomallei 1106b]|uniref:Uncharacterized protein n=1 Tax=Burkholderia pseudomallei (strain 1106a) TaxID=357348 RepID=A3P5B0_BURP0|nr:hypothetical protein BURPS1106A_A1486 [Burkholderia pseudomallei 1106a]EES21834.1 hypothetical protein BURPS1106B_0503 [Burkholderia pseudomallei 1106b]